MQKISEGVKVVCEGITITNDDEISAGMETKENSEGAEPEGFLPF